MKFGTFSAIILACTLSTGHMAHASWEITTDKAGMPMYKPESVQRHATREQHRPSRHHRQRDPFVPQHNDGYGIVTVSTQAGPIRVNARLPSAFDRWWLIWWPTAINRTISAALPVAATFAVHGITPVPPAISIKPDGAG